MLTGVYGAFSSAFDVRKFECVMYNERVMADPPIQTQNTPPRLQSQHQEKVADILFI